MLLIFIMFMTCAQNDPPLLNMAVSLFLKNGAYCNQSIMFKGTDNFSDNLLKLVNWQYQAWL